MKRFEKYRRSLIFHLRPVSNKDIDFFLAHGIIVNAFINPDSKTNTPHLIEISISEEDLKNGSPKIGDMIARNPQNYKEQWLVSAEYFKNNFEKVV